MAHPQAYAPEDGYQYQILCRNQAYSRAWEHCDYAVSRWDKSYLVGEYRLAYGSGWEFKVITLPQRCWPGRRSKVVLESMLEALGRLTKQLPAQGVAVPLWLERRIRAIPYATAELKRMIAEATN